MGSSRPSVSLHLSFRGHFLESKPMGDFFNIARTHPSVGVDLRFWGYDFRPTSWARRALFILILLISGKPCQIHVHVARPLL